jgi:hypothetical protein
MKTAVAISFELDDVALAAEQLESGIREKLGEFDNALGILYCDADVDGAALTGALSERLGCDVAGMTTLAALGPGGMNELSAVLTVMTGDGVSYATAATPPLDADTAADGIRSAYGGIKDKVGEPKLLLLFAPTGRPFAGDLYPDTLAGAAPGVPLLGGVASDDFDYARARTFLSGREYRDAAVFAGIAGDVAPRFFLQHVTSRFAERRLPVTKADGTTVYEVGGESFIEYLEGFGLRTDVDDAIVAFNSYPLMLTREGTGEVPLMRHISGLDHDKGAGAFLGNVPEGAVANICLVNKDDLTASCRISMENLVEYVSGADGTDAERSLVLCISCCGRSMILGTDADAEGRIMEELLPGGYSLAGAYCLGEFSPALYKDGLASNRFHNCSIALCAL